MHTTADSSLPLDPCVTDAALASRAAAGDQAAFELIMRRHNRLLFRTARSVLKSDEEAQDALQEAYLRAWRSLSGFRAEARLSTWLVRIVINEALGRLRRRELQLISLDESLDEGAADRQAWLGDDVDRQPERLALREEMRRLMETRIDALPEVFRSVFVLRGVQELSVEEVAQALCIPPATVRTRYFRARSLLREGLSQDLDMALCDAFSFDGERCDRIVARVLQRLGTGR
jgi:RNA polymerase sigma-70 factor (ECF subfamily)